MKEWIMLASSSLLLAGCGCSRQEVPPPPPALRRPPTPQEAMGLATASPLAAAAEHWIADTDLGDAWAQAKENVAEFEARLVADFRARTESGVGETPASHALRKDFDRWIGIHDRLKVFILDCQANGCIRDLPPDLARNFKNWPQLRRDLLRDAPASLDDLNQKRNEFRHELAILRQSKLSDERLLSALEETEARFARSKNEMEALVANAEAVARRFAADIAVGELALRIAATSADWRTLSSEVTSEQQRLRDRLSLGDFSASCARMKRWVVLLGGRVEAKKQRISEEKSWRKRVMEARKGGNKSVLSTATDALQRFLEAEALDKTDGDAARRDIRAFKKHFDKTSFARFCREFPEGARPTLASLLADVRQSVPDGRNPAAFLEVLETKADQLRDDYEEKTALAELEAAILH